MFLSLNLNGLFYHMQFPGLYEPLNAISICSKSSKIEIFTRKCLGKTQMCFEKNQEQKHFILMLVLQIFFVTVCSLICNEQN